MTRLGWVLLGLLTMGCKHPVDEFALSPGSHPIGITLGPDGNLWFTESGGPPPSWPLAGKIGRITPSGVITEFNVPTAAGRPWRITTGLDGNLWFSELDAAKIGRITVNGVITEFPLTAGASLPLGLGVGPDGRIWFREGSGPGLGTITSTGAVSTITVPTTIATPGLVTGNDRNVWLPLPASPNPQVAVIRRLSLTGSFVDFKGSVHDLMAQDITTGADGNVWFTEWTLQTSGDGSGLLNYVARITSAGVISEFPLLTVSAFPQAIARGPDGNVWFTQTNPTAPHSVSRITPAGVIEEVADVASAPDGITAGPDGNVWFTEPFADKIGRVAP